MTNKNCSFKRFKSESLGSKTRKTSSSQENSLIGKEYNNLIWKKTNFALPYLKKRNVSCNLGIWVIFTPRDPDPDTAEPSREICPKKYFSENNSWDINIKGDHYYSWCVLYENYHYEPVALKGLRQHRHLLHRAHVAEEHWTGDQLATEIFQGVMIINGLSFDNEKRIVQPIKNYIPFQTNAPEGRKIEAFLLLCIRFLHLVFANALAHRFDWSLPHQL